MSILQYCLRSRRLEQKLETSRTKMFRIAYSWCHDEMLADDLVQDTLSKALQRLSQLKNPDKLDSWLISILNNIWRDHLRRQKEFVDIDDYVHLSHESPENIHEREQTIQRVRKAVEQLPMGQRQVISLIDLQGLSYSEVSQVLEIPIGTVMSRLNRARNTMLEKLHNESRVIYLHKQHSLEKANV